MQVYGPGSTQHVHGTSGVSGPSAARRPTPATDASAGQPLDRVEISAEALEAARLAEAAAGGASAGPDVRTDLVNRLRAEIASGTYETPERLDGALDRLLNQLG